MSESVVNVYLDKTSEKTWRAQVDGPRGTGTEAVTRDADTCVLVALQRLAEAEGMQPGICLGCDSFLPAELCRIGALAHLECVVVEVGK